MKINFNDVFEQVHRRVQAPERPDPKLQGEQRFESVLADLVPGLSKPTEIASDRRINAEAMGLNRPAAEEVRARYMPPQPVPLLPQMTRMPVAPVETPWVNELQPNVKKPTLLSVRRVPAQDAFAGLSLGERQARVKQLVENHGRHNGLDPALGMAIASVESAFNPMAVSPDQHKTKGLFQLLDQTALGILNKLDISDEYNPYDPETNTKIGMNYLRYLHDVFSKETALSANRSTHAAENSSSLEKLAVAAFNAGEGRVASAQGRAVTAGLDPAVYAQIESYLPKSTQEYVQKVMRDKERFSSEFAR